MAFIYAFLASFFCMLAWRSGRSDGKTATIMQALVFVFLAVTLQGVPASVRWIDGMPLIMLILACSAGGATVALLVDWLLIYLESRQNEDGAD